MLPLGLSQGQSALVVHEPSMERPSSLLEPHEERSASHAKSRVRGWLGPFLLLLSTWIIKSQMNKVVGEKEFWYGVARPILKELISSYKISIGPPPNDEMQCFWNTILDLQVALLANRSCAKKSKGFGQDFFNKSKQSETRVAQLHKEVGESKQHVGETFLRGENN